MSEQQAGQGEAPRISPSEQFGVARKEVYGALMFGRPVMDYPKEEIAAGLVYYAQRTRKLEDQLTEERLPAAPD